MISRNDSPAPVMLPGKSITAPAPENKNNHFDLLRVVAACMVIWSHCHDLLKIPDSPLFFGRTMSTVGLTIFFSISGFLVTGSALSQSHFKPFLFRRAFRIWPGLALNILVIGIIVGPVFTTLSLREYITSRDSWAYFAGLSIFLIRWQLPGVWKSNPDSGINGSLWTIPHEFVLYFITWTLKKSGILRHWAGILCVLMPAALSIDFGFERIVSSKASICLLSVRWLLHFSSLFLAGAFFRVIWSAPKMKWFVLIFSWALQLFLSAPGHWHFFTFFASTGSILFLAHLPYGWIFSKLNRGIDFSYGIYLWGFPVQQILIHSFSSMRNSPFQLFTLTLGITLIIAYGSWTFIEKPALALARKA